MYDIIIIGAGPAGISAGIYAISRGKKVLVLEKAQVGGIIGKVSTVTHYTALQPRESGATFAARMKEQALAAGVEIAYETVTGVELAGDIKTVRTDKGVHQAPRIILTNGGTPRKLGIPGEAELAGKGMSLNAPRDAQAYAGRNLYVVGGADGAVKEALYLAGFARRLTIIHFEDTLGCIPEFRNKVAAADNITLRLGSRLHGVYGDGQVERLVRDLADAGEAPALVVVDYVQQYQSGEPELDRSEYGRVSEVTGRLQRLSLWGGFPLLMLSSLRKLTRQDDEPTLDWFRGSGVVGYSAWAACVITRGERDGSGWREALINVVKNKGGRSGIRVPMQLWGAYSWTRGME